ncbi:SAM-dependent methyltransferase [Odoribacter sp. Z80]|uniref:SAM-dependent methyltransferase n=1 Tax=Odoribacter sp. Z80 TaxID=2304575 RepID=UPI00137B675C|nr:SAM-dependent methyltransferase [Odoribacter sp. Z80]NCE71506.1 SAM-dependent methyltransferase [Odoribacter sp. Z80]
MGKLFLLPNTLGETSIAAVIPSEVIDVIRSIRIFASENPQNTRRYLKKIDKNIVIDELIFLELNEHSSAKDTEAILAYLEKNDVGIISEAGCAGIADPGAELVALAHQHDYRVIPLVGPSSILLSLMASGLNGQNFSFQGYLPVKNNERNKALKNYERQSALENRTQIFIETPYRNRKLFEEMLQTLHADTLLTIACDITTPNEYIKTLPVREWKKQQPDIHKRPAIFLIYVPRSFKRC